MVRLCPQAHLTVGRHGDWTRGSNCSEGSGKEGPVSGKARAAAMTWGVSTEVPGLDGEQARWVARQQQGR